MPTIEYKESAITTAIVHGFLRKVIVVGDVYPDVPTDFTASCGESGCNVCGNCQELYNEGGPFAGQECPE